MKGHVVKRTRNGRTKYYVVAELEPGPDGRRIRKSHGGFDRKKDASAHLTSVLAAQASGAYVEPSKLTYAQFLQDEWLPAIRATIRPSTMESYQRNIRNHIIPTLGNVPLRKLTPAQLNGLYAALAEGERPLSATTIRYVHVIGHRALKDAVRWGRLTRNPADAADPPRLTKGADMEAWSAPDLRRFLAGVRDDRLYPLYLLASTTGMRRGGLLGLRWSDLDLEKGRLSIRQTLISVAYNAQFSEPKTKRSRPNDCHRSGDLGGPQSPTRGSRPGALGMGPAWIDNGLVFTREDGKLIHPEAVSQTFKALAGRLQLPKLSFHGLRHSYATLALASGMKPWDLSDRLGHSSVAFTLQVYRHAIPADQDNAAGAAAAFILG